MASLAHLRELTGGCCWHGFALPHVSLPGLQAPQGASARLREARRGCSFPAGHLRSISGSERPSGSDRTFRGCCFTVILVTFLLCGGRTQQTGRLKV